MVLAISLATAAVVAAVLVPVEAAACAEENIHMLASTCVSLAAACGAFVAVRASTHAQILRQLASIGYACQKNVSRMSMTDDSAAPANDSSLMPCTTL